MYQLGEGRCNNATLIISLLNIYILFAELAKRFAFHIYDLAIYILIQGCDMILLYF